MKDFLNTLNRQKLNIFIWSLVTLGILSLIFSAVAIKLYSSYFPHISNRTEDWANFGSFLSGILSIIGAIITSLSLLAILKQNQSQQKFMEKERGLIDFEIYLKHRSLFIENLELIEKSFLNEIVFDNPDKLYRLAFPISRPTSDIEYNLPSPINKEESKIKGPIRDSIIRFNKICYSIQKRKYTDLNNLKNIIFDTYTICKSLRIANNRDKTEEELIINNETLGISIRYYSKKLMHIRETLVFLLYFSNHDASKLLSAVPQTNDLFNELRHRLSHNHLDDSNIEYVAGD